MRAAGIPAVTEFGGGSVGAAFKRADRRGARWVLLIGEDEAAAGTITCKNMSEGSQESVSRQDIVAYLESRE